MTFSRKAALTCGASAGAVLWASGAWAQMHNFNVPSEPAAKAIPEFARQAGVQITAPSDGLAGIQTQAITGDFDVHSALSTLLDGTGITIAADDGHSIVLASANLSAGTGPVRPAGIQLAQAQQVAQAAPAQTAQPAVEEVLVTGSLIHGAAAVGVPVTSLGQQDFLEAGAVTTSDLLKTQPSVSVLESLTATNTGGDIGGIQRVSLHNVGRTLLMVDGVRMTGQGINGTSTDPSFIPSLALDSLDVLADGASATYGSDAIGGVVNVLLKRGYDGAVSEFRISDSTDIGGLSLMGSQLYGRKWDSGDITLTYQYINQAPVYGPARDYFTYDFIPWGLNNVTPLNSADPGIVSIGSAKAPAGTPLGFATSAGTTCSNCFSIPKGQNGVGLTWAQILANPGESNEINPYNESWVLPQVTRSSSVLTFDQDIWRGGLVPDIQFFATGFYDHRNLVEHSSASGGFAQGNAFTAAVPTTNPYYPIGAPAGLIMNYDINSQVLGRGGAVSSDGHYEVGFNLDLPYSWLGKLFYARTTDSNAQDFDNVVNANAVSAALGNTVPASGKFASFTKPANIPYLNLFCDPTAFTCNTAATLNYIIASRQATEHERFNEAGATFDGPLFGLPGGPLRAAIGVDYLSEDLFSSNVDGTTSQIGESAPGITIQSFSQTIFASFAQLNVPIVGKDNDIPLIESLEFELSGRIDNYSTFGVTKNPKISATWNVAEGLTLRATLGTSFRAPSFTNLGSNGATIQPLNSAAGNPSDNMPTCPVVGQPAKPGSAAAEIDPNCTAALQFLGGLVAKAGGAALTALMSPPGFNLNPETSHNWAVGFDFAPTDFLRGFDLSASLYNVKIDGTLGAYSAGSGLDDPAGRSAFILNTDPNFANYVNALVATPYAQTNIIRSGIMFIQNGGTENAGWSVWKGIDFNGSYDWDMGEFGAWNAGIVGNFQLQRKSQSAPGVAVLDAFATGLNSGGRLNYRVRLGWTEPAPSAWSVTLFMNYKAHWGSNEVDDTTSRTAPPACFLIGNTPCNASGLPQFAQYTQQFPSITLYQPAWITFDLSVGYNLGDRPANDYLKNVAFYLAINDINDKAPTFYYNGVGKQANAYNGQMADPMQRVVSLAITKKW